VTRKERFAKESKSKINSPVEPNHYADLGVYAPVEVIDAWGLGFNLGNTVKYIGRAGRKTPDTLTDLKKAAWYLNREIKTREKRGDA
jgi:hypothetical protein